MSFLLILSIISPLAAIILGIRQKKYTLLWFYAVAGFVFDIGISFLRRGLHVGYKWPANIFILAEFILLSFIYRKRIFSSDVLFYTFVITFSTLFISHTIAHSVLEFNMLGSSLFTFTYILYGIAGLYVILREQKVIFLERSSFFWISVAFIIYSSGNLFLFLFRDYMIQVNERLYLALWNKVFLLLNITKNLLLAVALYHQNNKTRGEPY